MSFNNCRLMSNAQCPISNVQLRRGERIKSGFPTNAAIEIILPFITIGSISNPMKFDLDERLINYSVLILKIVDSLPDNKGANHLANQIVRSGTAPCLTFGVGHWTFKNRNQVKSSNRLQKSFRSDINCLSITAR
jgi:hypothetical protein